MFDKQKIIDFLSSFGVMLIGFFLLFIGSVGIKYPQESFAIAFPRAGLRQSFGGDINFSALPESRPNVPILKSDKKFSNTLSASSALVVDLLSDKVLFSKNETAVRPLASITKLMSAMVLMDLPLDASKEIIINENDVASNGSQYIKVGDKFNFNDLWNCALVGSANSAISALVRASGATESGFVELMNKKARNLNLKSLQFADPTGLYIANFGNAQDVAALLEEALLYEKIKISINTPQYFVLPTGEKEKRGVWSTNWLLTDWIPNSFDKNLMFGKTGYILDSGYNFVVNLADKKGHQIIVVILGASSNEDRFTEARDLGQWVFENYVWPDEDEYEKLFK